MVSHINYAWSSWQLKTQALHILAQVCYWNIALNMLYIFVLQTFIMIQLEDIKYIATKQEKYT